MPITENNSTSTKVTMRNGTPSKVSQSQTYTKSQSTTRRTYNEKYPWSSFLNIPTFAILFVMVIIGSSFLYYNDNIDTYMPTVDADGIRQPYKVEYLNDQPISELNGLTLNEVFEDNNFYDYILTETYNSIVIDKQITFTLSNAYARKDYNSYIINEHYYYITLYSSPTFIRYVRQDSLGNFLEQQLLLFVNEERKSLIFQADTNEAYDYISFRPYSYPTNDIVNYNDFYAIDLTELGIDDLTKEQMDGYYNLYQEQDGVQFDNYYYLDVDDYSVLGQKVVDGYNMAFNEGGIFYTALNLVDSVENALYTVYTMIFRSNVLMDQQFDKVSEDLREGLDPSMVYDPPSKIEQVYRALPKWMQPDTWFD